MSSPLDTLATEPRHAVAICGGAVAGSEAAATFAARGIAAIVFEQNVRPYGKIEDGLPRWHDKLRTQEYAKIDENLSRAGVYFVPQTGVGRDLPFETVRSWGLGAVVLANGAWRDRPIEVPGIDDYVGKGLLYQNPFVYWFNHYEDAGYDGPRYEIPDGAIVVGGGLASVDVIKIINIQLYRRALAARGHDVGVVELEHGGIAKTLSKLGIEPASLGVTGCTLYYRRRVADMPLASAKDKSPEALAKAEKIRQKIMQILEQKFFTRVVERHVPARTIIEGDRLTGLVFQRTEIRDRKVVVLPDEEVEVRAPLIVSSIGSVPAPLEGIPMRGELYDYASWDTGAVRGLGDVFGLGNVLTGKGNIKDSRVNAREVSELLLHERLGLGDGAEQSYDGAREAAQAQAETVANRIERVEPVPAERLRMVADALGKRWREVGYEGDYGRWIERHRPA